MVVSALLSGDESSPENMLLRAEGSRTSTYDFDTIAISQPDRISYTYPRNNDRIASAPTYSSQYTIVERGERRCTEVVAFHLTPAPRGNVQMDVLCDNTYVNIPVTECHGATGTTSTWIPKDPRRLVGPRKCVRLRFSVTDVGDDVPVASPRLIVSAHSFRHGNNYSSIPSYAVRGPIPPDPGSSQTGKASSYFLCTTPMEILPNTAGGTSGANLTSDTSSMRLCRMSMTLREGR